MSFVEKPLWGRELKLEIVFDAFEGEDVLPIQEDALHSILDSWNAVNNSKTDVRTYCLQESPSDAKFIRENDILNYVLPTQLFIGRDKDHHDVYLLCEYRFDPEEGIAVRFVDERLEEVASQQIVL